MKSKRLGCMLALIVGIGVQCPVGAENVWLYGALVAQPCTLKPGDENIRLELSAVIDKYLYTHRRTEGTPFNLTLQDCELSQVNTVRITFRGAESLELPGLLTPDIGSEADGIALGIETAEGKPVALNKPGQGFSLVNGENSLALQVYIQGEPTAVVQKRIRLGAFSAFATFSLEYE